ncbi:MAG TPA: ABC transporter ATP-binding protein [Symbiobacteriaceae bacterium]|jgi:branched-chain amino acid transport system ATP-binding protein
MLRLNNVEVMYDHVILVLKGMSLEVPEHKIVALLGANGSGKTTTLKAISGLLKSENGEVTDGVIEFMGEKISNRDAETIVRKGIFQVMEGRHVFGHLTVEENLLAGSYIRKDRANVKRDMDMVYHYFPRLVPRRENKAGYLSGGEQQMVAIGRALMANPKLVLLDEPSLGLAPRLVQEIFGIVKQLNEEVGTTFLVVEQNAMVALSIAHYGYIMENGKIVLEGAVDTLMNNEDVKEFYLGLTDVGRKSYRDVKAYKRRKRWLA